jgi:thymidine kinase
MAMKMIKPVFFADDLEEITHACDGCGSELSRTARLADKPQGQAQL